MDATKTGKYLPVRITLPMTPKQVKTVKGLDILCGIHSEEGKPGMILAQVFPRTGKITTRFIPMELADILNRAICKYYGIEEEV